MNIHIAEPQIGEIEEKLALEVLRSGRLAQGPMVERFEGAVGEVVGADHAIAVNNGTSALIAALMAAEIGPGDEVITSPLTFIATLNAILFVGAIPRYADITDDYTIDPESAHGLVNDATKAIIPIHLYGRLADMGHITRIAGEHDLTIVEDAAQALGARSPLGNAGQFGLGCFSFYATKNVTTGEGGIVTTDSAEIAGRLRQLRNQGQSDRYEYAMRGYNFRMTEIDAAIGVGQMSRLGDIAQRRRENAQALAEGLDGIEGLVIPGERPNHIHAYNQFTVRVEDGARMSRDQLREELASHGVDSQVYYPKLVFEYQHAPERIQPKRERTPKAAAFSRQVLSLPIHPGVAPQDLSRIIEISRSALG